MDIYSHRGNLYGPLPGRENDPGYIDAAIAAGFRVEVDVQTSRDKLWLGHDEPQYPIDAAWLDARADHLLIHAKNFGAMVSGHVFAHATEPFVFTSAGKIWLHAPMRPNERCIVPLITRAQLDEYVRYGIKDMGGICTDWPYAAREMFGG